MCVSATMRSGLLIGCTAVDSRAHFIYVRFIRLFSFGFALLLSSISCAFKLLESTTSKLSLLVSQTVVVHVSNAQFQSFLVR